MNNNENRCVVTVKKNVNVDALMEELCNVGSTNSNVPYRKVEMWNEKNDSLRNFDVVLTREEAEELKKDDRIIDVRYGSKQENGFFFKHTVLDSQKTYNRTFTQNSNHYPWSIPACLNQSNPFITTSLEYQHPYTAVGTGVDVVIQDSGIEVGHPEWLSLDGLSSRLKTVDWPSVSGFEEIYTQGALHYTDTYGHGTHCAGSAAGRRYGWAKDSDIYAIKIFDNDAFGISASFNMIRGWHNLKNTGRPTVVNMSWGFYSLYLNIVAGQYRGTPWTATVAQPSFGMVQSVYNDSTASLGGYTHPVRIPSVDADIEDCIDSGIILVAAAGNDAHKMDVDSGLDYGNYYETLNGVFTYYHRGSTPNGPVGVVSVGSVEADLAEFKSGFSNCGPGVTVYAPGEAMQSAIPVGADLSTGAVPHPDNANFLSTKISGTSMASPQAAGILACLVESRKHYSSKDCISWLEKTARLGRLSNSGGSYTDYQSLQGPNRYLQWPFDATNPLIVNRTT